MKNFIIYKVIRDYYEFMNKDTTFLLENEFKIKTLEPKMFLEQQDLYFLLTFFDEIEKGNFIIKSTLKEIYNFLDLQNKVNEKIEQVNDLLTNVEEDYLLILFKLYDTLSKSSYCINIVNCLFLLISNVFLFNEYKMFFHISLHEIHDLSKYYKCKNFILFKDKLRKINVKNQGYTKIYKQYTIEQIKTKLSQISISEFKLLNIKKIYLYGSLVKGLNTEHSDIDIHIVVDNPKFDLNVVALNIKKFFDNIFCGANFDITTTTLDTKQLNEKRLFFRDEIEVF